MVALKTEATAKATAMAANERTTERRKEGRRDEGGKEGDIWQQAPPRPPAPADRPLLARPPARAAANCPIYRCQMMVFTVRAGRQAQAATRTRGQENGRTDARTGAGAAVGRARKSF